MEALLTCGTHSIRAIVLYHPPPSQSIGLTAGIFFSEFSDFLEQCVLLSGQLLLVCDFNFHLDVSDDTEATKFNDLIYTFGLNQHIIGSTHKNGHTLDLAIT